MKFGLMIVVVALMGSILAGSMAMETGTHQVAAYNHVTDLAPIVTYDDVDTSIQYNPIRNVTGWTGVNYQTQTNPSIYAMQTAETSSSSTTLSLASYGGVHYSDGAAYGYDGGFAYGGEYPYIVWSDMESGTNPNEEQWPLMGWNPRYDTNGRSLMLGGYTQSWEQTDYRVESAVTVAVRNGGSSPYAQIYGTYADNHYYWQDLTRIAINAGWNTGTVVTAHIDNVTGGPVGVAYYYGTSFSGSYLQAVTVSDSWGRTETTWRTEATLYLDCAFMEDAQFWWDKNTATFHAITGTDDNGLPQFAAASTPLVWFSHRLTDTLTLTNWTTSNTTYVTPNTDVTLNGEMALWSNGYENDRVQFLVSPNANVGINYQANLNLEEFAGFALPSEASNYEMVLVTVDRVLSESYWQGVVSYNGPSDYTALSYKRPIFSTTANEVTVNPAMFAASYTYLPGSLVMVYLDGFGDGDFSVSGSNATLYPNAVLITDLEDTVTITYRVLINSSTGTYLTLTYSITPTYTEAPISSVGINSADSETVRMAMVNTWVPADPNGLLWQDPVMDLGHYFSDMIDTSGIRVTFGSVLSTGTSLTICGNEYETGGGNIMIDGSLYPINGLSVNINSNYVEIYSDDYSVASYTPTDDTITGEGVWSWAAALYEQTITTVEDVDIHFGEGSSREWMVFAFLGLCVLGIVVFAAWGRGSMDIWDWVVVGAAAILAFVVI